MCRICVAPSTCGCTAFVVPVTQNLAIRPRSGYYVNSQVPIGQLEPKTSAPINRPHTVEISDLVFEILNSARNRKVVPFGSAFSSPLLFPLARLARDLGSSMRRLDVWRTVEDLTPGNEALRRQLMLRYIVSGAKIDADEIVITNGPMKALNLCLQAVTSPGDTIAVESPCFYAALQALERSRIRSAV